MYRTRFALASAGLLLTAGCSGIGDGSRPESLKILQLPGTAALSRERVEQAPDIARGRVFRCILSQVRAFSTFTDGNLGEFTTRVTWASSDESILRVSNALEGDEVPGRDGLTYGIGTLLPQRVTAAGETVTVTASFPGLPPATIEVTVGEPGPITLEPSSLLLAPTTTSRVRVRTTLDGVMSDVTTSAFLSLVDDDDGDPDPDDNEDEGPVVVLDADKAEVSGLRPDTQQLSVEADLGGLCPDVRPVTVVRVAQPVNLRLEREADFYPPGADPMEQRLVQGFSQLLRVTAEFGDIDNDGVDDEQDVGSQILLALFPPDPLPDESTEDPDDTLELNRTLSFGSALLGRGNQVAGFLPGSVDIRASFGPLDRGADGLAGLQPVPPALDCSDPGLCEDDDTYLVSAALPFTVVNGPDGPPRDDGSESFLNALVGLTLQEPVPQSVDTASRQAQFQALGSFLLNDDSMLTHRVTRDLTWSVSAEQLPDGSDEDDARTIAVIENFVNSSFPGRVTAALQTGEPGGTVLVRATRQVGLLDVTPDDPADPDDFVETELLITPPPAAD